jgi:hypothetical protein
MLVGVAVLLGGAMLIFSIRPGHSAESCAGLDTALQNNLNFIAGQRQNPDALSDARIANRQAVVDQIQQRRAVAGCTGAGAGAGQGGNGNAGAGTGTGNNAGNAGPPANGGGGNANTGNGAAAPPASGNGQVVCAGDTVTTNGLGGTPGVASGTFPLGTVLRITNLDNNKSITVPVTDVSGSCALLNTSAFNQIHEPGKLLIRRATIEKVG